MLCKFLLTAFITIIFCTQIYAQNENIASRFFFPGTVGLGIPSGDEQTSMRSGFALNTAFEYRPKYSNAFFFRFNFDNISNKYAAATISVPTNVRYGKLNTDFFILGAGYRRNLKSFGFYVLAQPGYNMSNYEVVGPMSSSYSINNVSRKYLAGKVSVGFEYYIVPHFALVFEPGYYHLFSPGNMPILNPNYVSFSVGFTTTLF